MRFSRFVLFRPTRTSDGAGGFTKSYTGGAAFWGATRLHQQQMMLTYGAGADIVPEDVIDTGEETYYRVTDIIGHIESPYREALIERIERPIFK